MTTLTKDEVLKLAREAGFIIGRSVTTGEPNSPERFAHLCRADLVAENEQLRTELATANERHAGLMLAVVDRDKIIKQYAAAMKRGEA